ncbi:MAG: ATP-binding protein [Phormidesmis sp.]
MIQTTKGATQLSINGRAEDRTTYQQQTEPEHIVLAARTGVNADVLKDVLAAEAEVRVEEPTVETVEKAIAQEASLIVITEEVLIDQAMASQLGNHLSNQPTWSDIPIIILLSECKRFDDCLALLGQTTHHRSVLLLELPLRRMTFSTIVRTCLQNRRRQCTLRDTLAQLEESNQTLESFSYTAAHELRNPLGVAKTSFDLLARTTLEPKQQKFVEMGQRTTQKMDQLIGTLLDYSRVTANADSFTTVNMTSVVQETIDGLQVLIRENQADVTYGALPTVFGNHQLLVQLVSNLVKNAIVHNTSANPKVVISAQTAENFEAGLVNSGLVNSMDSERDSSTEQASSDGKAPPKEDRWFFFIADNGPGIAPEAQTQIFEMFNRAGKSRTDGNGIGLALCQRVARQHQTIIKVKSTLGSGSTFYFDLGSGNWVGSQ